MPDEDKNFGGSLVLDFRKWWRHVKTIYIVPFCLLLFRMIAQPCGLYYNIAILFQIIRLLARRTMQFPFLSVQLND